MEIIHCQFPNSAFDAQRSVIKFNEHSLVKVFPVVQNHRPRICTCHLERRLVRKTRTGSLRSIRGSIADPGNGGGLARSSLHYGYQSSNGSPVRVHRQPIRREYGTRRGQCGLDHLADDSHSDASDIATKGLVATFTGTSASTRSFTLRNRSKGAVATRPSN